MGLIRFLLSIAVLATHSENLFFLRMPSGSMAVEAFFLISGFYMSLIFNEKYSKYKNGIWLFISNRFLRLFPVYWVILILTVIASLVYGFATQNFLFLQVYGNYFHQMNFLSLFFLLVTNLILFFQDVVMFLGLNSNGGLFFTENFKNTNPQLWNFLLVPQAWTIGIELAFYLTVPFLFRIKTFYLVVLLMISVGIKIILINAGLNFDPWSHRFMPAEFYFFVGGFLCHRFYKYLLQKEIQTSLLFIPFVGMVLATAFFQYIPSPSNEIRFNIYLAALAVCLPFIFLLTRKSKLDQWLGEFTYPVYLVHFLVIAFVFKISENGNLETSYTAEVSLFITMVISYFLFTYISKPIEKIRQHRLIK